MLPRKSSKHRKLIHLLTSEILKRHLKKRVWINGSDEKYKGKKKQKSLED